MLVAPAVAAHPLGNFSVNHMATVKVSSDRVDVRYVLDQAEVPTFQERGEARGAVLAAKRAEVARGLRLRVNGRAVPLELKPGGELTMPEGQGGLRTTRVELKLAAAVDDPRSVGADRRHVRRTAWAGRPSSPSPGKAPAVRTNAPSGDPTGGLRRYPQDLLNSPLDRRSATFAVEPGDGSLVAPRREGAAPPRRVTGPAGVSRRSSTTPPRARACCCCFCLRRSDGAPCTRCHPATARRWSRLT